MPPAEPAAEPRRLTRGAREFVMRMMASRGGTAATVQTLATSVLILGLNLGTGMITARLLGPIGRGELAAIVVWPQFMAFLLTLGLPSSLLYNLKCQPDRTSQVFSATLMLGSVMGVIAAVAGAALIPLWLTEYSSDIVRFAQWAMVTAPLALLSVVLVCALLAREEFRRYNVARLLQPFLCLVMLGLLAATGLITPYTASVAILVAPFPICLWMLVRLWRIYRPRLRGAAGASRSVLSYGLRIYGTDLIGTLAEQIDRIFFVGLLDPAMMGLYVVALSFAQVLNVIPASVLAVLFPKTSGRPTAEVVALTGRAVRISLMANCLLAGAGAILGPYALGILYGHDFLAAGLLLRILLLEAVLRGTVWILAQAFMSLGRPGLVTLLQAAGLVLVLPLMLVLVPMYGLAGAGLSLLISTSVRLILILICFPLILKHLPPSLLFKWDEVGALLRHRDPIEP